MYQEDLLLGWKARLAGLRVVIEPGADVYHDYEYGRNPAKHYLLERNRLVFVLSSYSPRLLLLLSPVLVSTELAMAALAAREGWLRGQVARLGLVRPQRALVGAPAPGDPAPASCARSRARAASFRDARSRHDPRPGRCQGREPARRGLLAAGPPCAVTELSVVLVNHDGADVPARRFAGAGGEHGLRGRRVPRRGLRLDRRELAGRQAALGPRPRASLRGEHRLLPRLQPGCGGGGGKARRLRQLRRRGGARLGRATPRAAGRPRRLGCDGATARRRRARRSRPPGSRSLPTWPPSAAAKAFRGRRRRTGRST